MIFEWLADPAAWAGLATLIVLEIVLGIDNLVFIAILADKLPEHQRDKARLIGLSLALVMRIGLLAAISWIVTLTQPLFAVLGQDFSGRDLILLLGGLFLLFKGTMELHERLEGHHAQSGSKVAHAVFWQVLVQIVVLDAVFSLDSVITAVGMIDELSVMIIAVIVAVGAMMLASKPLMVFVSKHPTVVVLCLGLLMMIGFSLIADGFGFEVPKGYLYAAIGFSILVEAFNQTARRNRERWVTTGDLRERTANAVFALLGGRRSTGGLGETADVIAQQAAAKQIFAPEEKEMIQGVLALAERSVKSIMTPRTEIGWLDVDTKQDALRSKILELGHSRFLLARGSLDNFLGVALATDLLQDLLGKGHIDLERSIRRPLVVHESLSALRLVELLRKSPLQVAIILDEFGSLEGIATPIDILEAIAGEFPDEGEDEMLIERAPDGSWLADGGTDVRRLSNVIDVQLVDETDRYSTLAGYILWRLGHLPKAGERVVAGSLTFEVVSMAGHSIGKVKIFTS
jgi:CBS domain containing-hemolysin-like protein